MRNLVAWGLSLLLIGWLLGGVLAPAHAALDFTDTSESTRYSRPGRLAAHSTVAVVVGSTATAALVPNSVYRVICSDDVFADQGLSTVVATTSEAYLPADTVQYWRTTDTQNYFAFLRKTADCTCYLARED